MLVETLSELYARVPMGMRLGLGPMREACARFDHPERGFPSVHVAGTNGKGSVAAMVESIARASGLRTGLFTSPHLSRFAERIRVGGEPIDDETLASAIARVLEGAPALSFFECATLAAFLVFREAKVDLAVVEVGIGGRLDATNVLPPPRVTAITRIALDHTDRLGETLTQIAREKAGISKPGVPLVLGPMPDESDAGATSREVRGAIEAVAAANGARIVDADGADFRALLAWGFPPLLGDHQVSNASVAYRVARLLGMTDEAIGEGLRTTRWAGRLERIDLPGGAYLIDAAHNPDGADALARYLEQEASALPAPRALVFGTLADKAWPLMIDRLAPLFDSRTYVAPPGRAATPPEAIAARRPGAVAATIDDACARARAFATPDGLVVVAGSILLIGRVRASLLGLPSDPPVAL